MKPAYLLLLILFNLFWAATYSAFKVLAPYLDSGGIVTLRYGLAAMGLFALWPLLPGKSPRGRDLLKTLIMGIIVFAAAPRLQVAGVQLGQAGDASVLMALEPLITSIAAAIFLSERIAPRRWFGFGFGILGVVLLARVWRPDFKLPGLTANLLFVSSFVCETAYSVMGKPLIERAGYMKIIALALLGATLLNFSVDGHRTLAAAQALPLYAWGIIVYLASICTVMGYALWFVIIRETPVNLAALTIFIQPVAGVAFAGLWLHEHLHWGQLWGVVAIVIGLVVGLPRARTDNALQGGAS